MKIVYRDLLPKMTFISSPDSTREMRDISIFYLRGNHKHITLLLRKTIAKNILPVQCSSVTSESKFSHAGDLVALKRTSLSYI